MKTRGLTVVCWPSLIQPPWILALKCHLTLEWTSVTCSDFAAVLLLLVKMLAVSIAVKLSLSTLLKAAAISRLHQRPLAFQRRCWAYCCFSPPEHVTHEVGPEGGPEGTGTDLWNPSLMFWDLLCFFHFRPGLRLEWKIHELYYAHNPGILPPKPNGNSHHSVWPLSYPFHVEVVKSTLTCKGQVAWETDRKSCAHVVSIMRYTACTRSQKCSAC